MSQFVYTARARSGDKVEGAVEAPDRRTALAQIERLGHVPITVEEKTAQALKSATTFSWRKWLRPQRHHRMGMRDMLTFTTELSDLLASGMKLGNALNILAHRRTQADSDFIVRTLRDEIIRGVSLSDALAKFKETFPTLYVSLIRAGEASGNQAEVMQRIVAHYERMQDLKEKIVMALVYPAFVMGVGLITLVFCMTFVIPRFASVFKELKATLPLPTKMLIAMSDGLVHYGWLILIVLVILGILARRYLRSEAGQRWWHGVQLRLPAIRDLVTASAFTQFARTLGMLVGNGVSVLDALSIAERTVQNSIIAGEIRNARDRVTDGTTISKPLAAGKIFPPMLTDMLAIGEETGDMSGALNHIARRYENQLDRNIKVFTTILEPLLIVVMAVLVGFVAISILLAVVDLTSGLNA